jgi:hypothetical protein
VRIDMRATLHSGSREFQLPDTKSAVVNRSFQKLPGSLAIARLKPLRKSVPSHARPPSERSALQLPLMSSISTCKFRHDDAARLPDAFMLVLPRNPNA